jgi:hypothetical protein
MYIHNNVKPFACGVCSKEFTQAKSLKFHVSIEIVTVTILKYIADFIFNDGKKAFFHPTFFDLSENWHSESF